MNFQQKIFSIGRFDITPSFLLIFLILSLSFSISFLLRSLPMQFGWELHEFDPFFNFRATEYIVNYGITNYFEWNDELSWYPHGRDISSNSQITLHIFTAITYWIFGNNISLYDYVILFPVIIGSLTGIIVFGITRILAGTTAGLFASLLFSISLPILVRGQIGWFKSEPLGLFLGLIGIFLLLYGIKLSGKKIKYFIIICSALITTLSISAWGGNIFFLVVIGIFICCIPFLRKDHSFLLRSIPIYTISILIFSFSFERLGTSFVSSMSGFSLILPTIFLICVIFVQRISSVNTKNRNSLIVVIILVFTSFLFLILNDTLEIVSLPTHRYLNAVYPLLTTSDPLIDSISEHGTLTIQQSFQFHLILMVFAGLGIWISLSDSQKVPFTSKEMTVFTLILGLFAVYIGSAFMRLEVFTSIGIIILSSIGLTSLIRKTKKVKDFFKLNNSILTLILAFGIIFILIIPMFTLSSNVLTVASTTPPTIMNGATIFQIGTDDWRNTLEWIKMNTPKDSVIGSWWDYGYWIQTISERKTLSDNSTLIDHRIKNLAQIFFETPNDAWLSLTNLEADYFIIFISGETIPYETNDGKQMYVLYGGGDESKTYWFAKIADIETRKYLESDFRSGTKQFWNETFLGKIIPFENLGYVNFNSNEISEDYVSGWTPVFTKQSKLSEENEPFILVYASPSFINEENVLLGIFVYEINKNYSPTD